MVVVNPMMIAIAMSVIQIVGDVIKEVDMKAQDEGHVEVAVVEEDIVAIDIPVVFLSCITSTFRFAITDRVLATM